LVELGLNFMEVLQYIRRRKLFRRWWSKPHIRRNYLTGYNGYQRVFKYFKLNDEEEFINFTRIPVYIFEYLYQLLRVSLIKRSRRPPLPSELRLSLTLNYLAHADSIKKNKWFYNIGETTIKKVIPEFMSDLFYPNCIGALDGKYCKIKKLPNSGSLFYNYKKFFSIVFFSMACCDSKKRFIWANIEDYGSLNDASIFAHSDLEHALLQNEIQLPRSTQLPNSQIVFPFHFMGDGIFPLKTYLMKPFDEFCSENN
ncbi:uncharacterized protein LOC131675622, partial [Phymastichus coffea]|uniref:uncharacterized protein LOC131675622 n=1 Tax=Phymastichus coffea TaxID=108790 RepID=UPI00273B01E8